MLSEKIENLVEKAWDNGIVDYANRKSAEERELTLAFTPGKIEGNIPSITQEILSLFRQEIEKMQVINQEQIWRIIPHVGLPEQEKWINDIAKWVALVQVQDCKDTLLRGME